MAPRLKRFDAWLLRAWRGGQALRSAPRKSSTQRAPPKWTLLKSQLEPGLAAAGGTNAVIEDGRNLALSLPDTGPVAICGQKRPSRAHRPSGKRGWIDPHRGPRHVALKLALRPPHASRTPTASHIARL